MKSKYLISLAMLAFSASGTMAQTLIPDENNKGKWGYVDQSGAVVVKYNYDHASAIVNGYARVGKNAKWGYIDSTGKEVLKPEYDEITTFINGVARVKKGNKYGFINTRMELVIPCKYTSVGSFNEKGLVWVLDGKKYGIYRNDGSVFLKPDYKALGYFLPFEYTYTANDLKDEKSYTDITHYQNDPSHHTFKAWNIVDAKLGDKLPDDALGFWYSSDAAFKKNGVMDADGTELIRPGKYVKAFYPSDGYAKVITKERTYASDDYNFLNISTGKLLLNDSPVYVWSFHDGVALAQYNYNAAGKPTTNLNAVRSTKWYFIDTNGKRINTTSYDNIFARNDGVYVVKRDNKYGMADAHGLEILAPEYASIMAGVDGLFSASSDNAKYGYLNNKGEWAVLPQYDMAAPGSHGYLPVRRNERWGFINNQGNILVPIIYDDVIAPTEPEASIIWVKKGDKLFAHSVADQKLAYANGFAGAYNYDQHFKGIALVQNGENKFGCVDATGQEIVPLEFSDFDVVQAIYKEMVRTGCKTWRPIIGHRIKLGLLSEKQSYRLKQTLDNSNWQY